MSEKNSPSPPRSRSASQAKGSDHEMTSPARGDAAGETQAFKDQEMPDTEAGAGAGAGAATSDTTAGATLEATAGATLEDGGGDREDKTVENPGNNLYVANLATRVGQADLQELFDKYGRVCKCEVIVDPVTRESRYGKLGTCGWLYTHEGYVEGNVEE